MIDVSQFTIFNCPNPCCNDYETCLAVDPKRCYRKLKAFYDVQAKKRISESRHMRSDLTEDCLTKKEGKDVIKLNIPLGTLCCFKPISKNIILFGYVVGKIVDDFEKMSFAYVVSTDSEYYFSKEVIEKPTYVHTLKDAEQCFM